MVTSNDPDTEDVLLVVKDLKPFYTALGREARLEINLSHTTNGETSTPSHRAAAHEGLEDVWLFKSSHYGPNLQVTGSQKKKNFNPAGNSTACLVTRVKGIGSFNEGIDDEIKMDILFLISISCLVEVIEIDREFSW